MGNQKSDYVIFYPIVKSSTSKGFCMKIYHENPVLLENLKQLLIDACAEMDVSFENHPGLFEVTLP